MGKKSSPKPPETPDYMAIAQQQEGIDRRTAEHIADMSRINQVNPMGTQSWSQGDDGRWTMTQSLSPEQQQMFDTAQGLNIGVGQAATDALGDYTSMIGQPLDFSGAPERISSVSPYAMNMGVDSAQFGDRFDMSSIDPRAAMQAYQGGIDTSGFSAIPGADDFGGQRQEVIDAVYSQGSRMLDPQFQNQEDAMRTRLLNSGVREGTEAWNKAWDDFSRSRTGAYGDLRDRAIVTGGAEQSRMLRDALGIRGQQYGEEMGQAGLANQAAQLANQYGLSARGQDFGENLAAAQQGDAEAMNRLQADLAELGFENQAAGQAFGQDMAAADFQNQQRNQAIQEILMQRQIPMDELAGIIGASGQFNLPQFAGGTQNVPQYQGADVMGATQAGFGADMSKYNAEMAGSNAKKGNAMGLGGTLGSAAILASDVRFKKNVEKIGTANGHNIYVWDWNDKAKLYGVANHPRVGVMAQEIQETNPDAVVELNDGYLAVDYSKVWEK
jgi:hypothetical protein